MGTAQAIAYERMLESKREDRLFNDHLAQHFCGEKGEGISKFITDAMKLMMKGPITDDYNYRHTAARTKLINDHLDKWITETQATGTKMQITNLGAGCDTRAFWFDSLSNVERYVEVDDAIVINAK